MSRATWQSRRVSALASEFHRTPLWALRFHPVSFPAILLHFRQFGSCSIFTCAFGTFESSDRFYHHAVTTQDPQSPPSDNDGGERPVRKQLRETTIESNPSKENGRKRSFEESRDGPNDSPDDSRRKRSRETTPNNGQSTGAATSSNVSDNQDNPEHLLPATPEDLAKEDSITQVPQTEIPETQLDIAASYPRPAYQGALDSDSAREASDELFDGTDEGDFSSGLDEPKKSEIRDFHKPYNKFERTESSASQVFEQPGNPSEPRIPAEVSSPWNSDMPNPSAYIESQEPHPLDIPKQPKESNMSADSESYEDHPALKPSSIEPDEFEDHPKSQSDDSSDFHFLNSPSKYNASAGSPEAEAAVYHTRNLDIGKATNHLQDHGQPEDSTLLQEKPPEYNAHPRAFFESANSRFIESYTRNENSVNTDPSSQESSNPATTEPAKGLTKKRSREQLEKASPKKSETMSDPTQESDSAKTERETKRHRDNSEEREKATNKVRPSVSYLILSSCPDQSYYSSFLQVLSQAQLIHPLPNSLGLNRHSRPNRPPAQKTSPPLILDLQDLRWVDFLAPKNPRLVHLDHQRHLSSNRLVLSPLPLVLLVSVELVADLDLLLLENLASHLPMSLLRLVRLRRPSP